MKYALLIALLLAFIGSNAFAEEINNAEGRTLPGGIWQPRNLQATLPDPYPGMPPQGNITPAKTQDITQIEWGPEVRLTQFPFDAFYGAITEEPEGYIHIVVCDINVNMHPFYMRSTDRGQDWSVPFCLVDSSDIGAVFPLIFADSCYITVPFSENIFRSVQSIDYGACWGDWRRTYLPGHRFSATQLGDTIFAVFYTDAHITECYYTANHGTDWLHHSTQRRIAGESAVGATSSALHLINETEFEEIFYSRYLFSQRVWGDTVRISDYNDANSFDPEMVAWGDSNILAIWLDYKYSPYPWNGDLLIRRSTDNGESWLPEQQVTYNHLAFDKNLYVRNDTIYLVYDEIVLDGETNTEEVFFNWSTDKGETWDNPVRLTNAPYRSIYPAISVRDNRIHVIYCDARDDTLSNPPGYRNTLFYRQGRLPVEGINDDRGNKPDNLSLSAYPNPFNSSTTITIQGLKGGEAILSIYDISGRLIKTYKGDVMGGKKVWDASDATGKSVSSGIYFARASTPNQSKSIKLVYMK